MWAGEAPFSKRARSFAVNFLSGGVSRVLNLQLPLKFVEEFHLLKSPLVCDAPRAQVFALTCLCCSLICVGV